MESLLIKLKMAAAATIAALAMAGPAAATVVQVKVTNTSAIALTPLYFGFHNGTVDLFDLGGAASAGIEQIAELGVFMPLRDERLAQQANSVGGAALGLGVGAPGPIEPGETAIFTVDLDAIANRFVFFASMVIPSNDTFIGVDNPTQFALFDAAGNFQAQTINITGDFAYDAGTEVNDASASGGAAFVQGVDAMAGAIEGAPIRRAFSLSDFVGLTLANGSVLGGDIDFITNPGSFVFATVEFSEVPIPPALALMGAGLLGLGGVSARRARKA
jgi:hypothetical protein